MEKNIKSKKHSFGKIIIALLLCLFCSFSFAGCAGGYVGGAGKGTKPSQPSTKPSDPSDPSNPAGGGANIKDFNDVFLCAIGAYQIDGEEPAFYDKHIGDIVSYNDLVERQFDTIATYIYSTLNRIYGAQSSSKDFEFSGFGDRKKLYYDTVISDNNQNQKIIAGLSDGQLENKDYLNYFGAINGGYKLNVTDNGDGTYITSYDTNTVLSDYEWKGKGHFSKDKIKKALGYIYKNQRVVKAPDSKLSFSSDADSLLRNYYINTFKLTDESITNFDFSTIDSLGITNKYIWNVAYYVAFGLIGETNISNSIGNNHNTIFTGSRINAISSTNIDRLSLALEQYKGYHLVLADLMSNIKNLNIASNTAMSVSGMDSENTCFPELKKEKYIYYDNINDLCDANNDDLTVEDDSDYEISEDGEDFDESAMDNVDVGTAFRLSRIILIPRIDVNKNNISSFNITGILLGFQTETTGTYQVELSVTGLDKDGEEIIPKKVKIDEKESTSRDPKITYDETYKLSQDLIDISIDLGTEISSMEIDDVADIQTFVEDSFSRDHTRTVEYASGGTKTISFGYLNVYNSLIDSNGQLTATKSYLEFNFDYYSSSGNALTEIPRTYLMYFCLM